MSNPSGWVAPGYLAPADWTKSSVRLTVGGTPIDIPHTGYFVPEQGDLDTLEAAITATTPCVFMVVPPMGYTYDPGQQEPSPLYPTPSLLATWLSAAMAATVNTPSDAQVATYISTGGSLTRVQFAIAAKADVVSDTAYNATSWNGVTNIAPSKNAVRDEIELRAPLASPTFSGAPSLPTGTICVTQSPGDNDTSVASTAFVTAADAALWAAKRKTATAALDFPSIAAQTATLTTSATLTITVTGAAVNDDVIVSPPAAINAGLIWQAWVSAADTVSIRLFNHTAAPIDPASGTWRATVLKA